MTREELKRTGPDWYKTIVVGIEQRPNHTIHRITKGFFYKATVSGEMEESEWVKQYRKAIETENLTLFFGIVKEHIRKHCAWLHKEDEIERYAMECFDSGAFASWWQNK